MNQKVQRSGFTIVELLVFVAIISIFFVTAAAVVTISLRNQQVNEHKIIATHYAQDAIEWLRGEKEDGWTAFVTHAGINSGGLSYCMNTTSVDFNNVVSNPAQTCASSKLNGFYNRYVTLTALQESDLSVYQVNIQVFVSWFEYGRTYTVPVNTSFAIWER